MQLQMMSMFQNQQYNLNQPSMLGMNSLSSALGSGYGIGLSGYPGMMQNPYANLPDMRTQIPNNSGFNFGLTPSSIPFGGGFNFTNIPPVPPTAPDQNTRELSSVVYI